MSVELRCGSCGLVAPGRFNSYEEWEDTARALGWFVEEESVLCPTCG